MNRIFKIWIIIKTSVTIIFLMYVLYNFFSPAPKDEESELYVVELFVYTITSLLFVYCFFKMYRSMTYVILFDIIFLIFIAYHFHVNYIIVILDLITIFFITFDNNTVKNYVKRRLRKLNINPNIRSQP
ncbi:MAG: hypothetical protein ABI416_14710 [Ginsengibacter sp.]